MSDGKEGKGNTRLKCVQGNIRARHYVFPVSAITEYFARTKAEVGG